MKLAVVAAGLFALGCLPSSASAQNWSDWITSNNHDVQYRWLSSSAGGSGECQLQLRDQKRNATTVVSVAVDYKSEQDESTRETVTIAGSQKDEDQGPTIVHRCASISDLHVTNIARR